MLLTNIQKKRGLISLKDLYILGWWKINYHLVQFLFFLFFALKKKNWWNRELDTKHEVHIEVSFNSTMGSKMGLLVGSWFFRIHNLVCKVSFQCMLKSSVEFWRTFYIGSSRVKLAGQEVLRWILALNRVISKTLGLVDSFGPLFTFWYVSN